MNSYSMAKLIIKSVNILSLATKPFYFSLSLQDVYYILRSISSIGTSDISSSLVFIVWDMSKRQCIITIYKKICSAPLICNYFLK